jgi:type IV pilus biogenesis protein PilP
MQPNFALRLRQDRITLLHRGKAGWHPVGHVSPQAADLDDQLAMLRSTATAMSPSGLSCKLIIPDTQILYRELPDPGGSDDDCAAAVRHFLDGGTPYALDDLVWDYCSDGRTLFVAACARETLAEAESFASQYRFNPVSFVASPDAPGFDREMFFGTAALAATLMPKGDVLVPDNQLMRVIGEEIDAAAPTDETAPGAASEIMPGAEPEAEAVQEIVAVTIAETVTGAGAEAGAGISEDISAETTAGSPPETAADSQPVTPDLPETAATGTTAAVPAYMAADLFENVAAGDQGQGDSRDTTTPPTQAEIPEDAEARLQVTQDAVPASPDPEAAPDALEDPAANPADLAAHAAPEDGSVAAPVAQPEGTATFASRRDKVADAESGTGDATTAARATTQPGADGTVAAPRLHLENINPETAAASASEAARHAETLHVPVNAPDIPAEGDTEANTATAPADPRPAQTSARADPCQSNIVTGKTSGDSTGVAETKPLPGPADVPTLAEISASQPTAASQATPAAASAPDLAQSATAADPQPPAPGPAAAATKKPEAGATGAPAPLSAENRFSGARRAAGTSEEEMTVFGARRQKLPLVGKPRLAGLLLTFGLILLLGAIALWAVTFYDGAPENAGTAGTPGQSALPAAASPIEMAVLAAPQSAAAPAPANVPAPVSTVQPAPDVAPGTPGADTAEQTDTARADTGPAGSAETRLATAGAEQADPALTVASKSEPLQPAPALNGVAAPLVTGATVSGELAPQRPASGTTPATLATPAALAAPAAQLPPADSDTRPARDSVTEIADHAPGITPPQDVTGIEQIYVASVDPVIQPQDAIALPQIGSADLDESPGAIASPAPAGARFDLDARGLVRATAEGALTPEGVRVFTGRPAAAALLRPGSVLEARAIATNPAADSADLPMLLALAASQPRLRPAALLEASEKARLGGVSMQEIAATSPRLRPQSDQAVAREIQLALAASGGSDSAATAPVLSTSLMPRARPKGFGEKAAKVLAAAEQAAERAAQRAKDQRLRTAAAAAAAAAAPRVVIPSKASVARQATVEDAIKLRQLNLIGVFGPNGKRRALLRLKNGALVEVKVGDKLDGGRVTAISETELRYVKRSREVVLTSLGRG